MSHTVSCRVDSQRAQAHQHHQFFSLSLSPISQHFIRLHIDFIHKWKPYTKSRILYHVHLRTVAHKLHYCRKSLKYLYSAGAAVTVSIYIHMYVTFIFRLHFSSDKKLWRLSWYKLILLVAKIKETSASGNPPALLHPILYYILKEEARWPYIFANVSIHDPTAVCSRVKGSL